MSAKTLLMMGALTLSSLTIANAKSYDIILGSDAQAGNLQLKAGEYKVQLRGDNAVFTRVDNSKSYTAPVKVESKDKKFDQTAVESSQQGDIEKIRAIDLGGSTTQIEFAE